MRRCGRAGSLHDFCYYTEGDQCHRRIPDKRVFIDALDGLYRFPERRETYRHRGLSLVQQPQYRWENIGERFAEQLEFAYTGVYKTSPEEMACQAS